MKHTDHIVLYLYQTDGSSSINRVIGRKKGQKRFNYYSDLFLTEHIVKTVMLKFRGSQYLLGGRGEMR